MTKGKGPKNGDYEVGYGKPPKHSRYVPGQSGFKGQTRKPRESQAQVMARVRDEVVTVNGKTMTMFELMVRSAINQAAKRGSARELKAVLDLLEQHGAMPQADLIAQARADGEEAMRRIGQVIERTFNADAKDVALGNDLDHEEVMLVMSCPDCSAELRRRWADPEYEALRERYQPTLIHRELLFGERKRLLRTHRPGQLRSKET